MTGANSAAIIIVSICLIFVIIETSSVVGDNQEQIESLTNDVAYLYDALDVVLNAVHVNQEQLIMQRNAFMQFKDASVTNALVTSRAINLNRRELAAITYSIRKLHGLRSKKTRAADSGVGGSETNRPGTSD